MNRRFITPHSETQSSIIRVITIFCFFIFSVGVRGEERPVTGSYAFEIGGTETVSTYLSPLKFTGKIFGASGRWGKALPYNAEKAVMEFNASLYFSDMLNRSHTASMNGISASFDWGMSWRKNIYTNLQLSLGGKIGVEGGALYLGRNSNNPVTAIADLSIYPTAGISYHFRCGKLPILVTDRLTLPLAGLFFSPEYGETYYEIYLGNHSGLIHPGWWGSDCRISNSLSAILDFGRTSMEIGYRFSFSNQYSSHLTTRRISHLFSIGVIPGGIGLKNKKNDAVYYLY